jgi:hypothetical protein
LEFCGKIYGVAPSQPPPSSTPKPTPEPDEYLTDELNVSELIEQLEQLRFRTQSRRLLSVDRGVRDYIVRALKHR